eukprot:8502144-Pyramimonas_sp.AAC.1
MNIPTLLDHRPSSGVFFWRLRRSASPPTMRLYFSRHSRREDLERARPGIPLWVAKHVKSEEFAE